MGVTIRNDDINELRGCLKKYVSRQDAKPAKKRRKYILRLLCVFARDFLDNPITQGNIFLSVEECPQEYSAINHKTSSANFIGHTDKIVFIVKLPIVDRHTVITDANTKTNPTQYSILNIQ